MKSKDQLLIEKTLRRLFKELGRDRFIEELSATLHSLGIPLIDDFTWLDEDDRIDNHATDLWGGAGPDCINGQREAAQ